MNFDFQNNLNYNVFNLQSHCIFVILLGLLQGGAEPRPRRYSPVRPE